MTNRLQLFAQQAAAAIKNARLYEQTRRQSEELEFLYGRVSRLEQLKSDMIRIAAHDLKNPLGVILSYLEFLNMPDVQVDQAQIYDSIKRAADRMNQIIHDFLSLDRITQVAEQKMVQQFDLSEVVSKVADEFARRAEDRSQNLTVSVPDAACIVHGDSAQIYEAIANFIGNAIKYTPDTGRISVTLAQEDGCARLEVTDTGYGIPEDQHAKLFAPFFRVESSETKDIEGTGLGLYLAKNIIERQGGTMIFRSARGQGSTFGFQLPLYDMVQEKDGSPPDLFTGVS
jgi:signal transduction histidine kinase